MTHGISKHSQHGNASQQRSHRIIQRYLWFIAGLVINSLGIALITTSELGTSPISSVPYVLDLAFAPSFGEFTFAMNMVFILAQILLLRGDFKPIQFLQIAANLIFSCFLDVSMSLLSWIHLDNIAFQAATLLVGCCILALGLAIEIAPNVIVVPGEGIVRAIAAVTKKPFGTCKVCFDTSLACLAVAFSFLFFGGIRGLGIGTVVSAVIVGQIVNVFNRHLPLIAAVAHLARDGRGAPESEL